MYWRASQVGIPSFVRIKPRALGQLGIYAQREAYRKPVFLVSAGLPEFLTQPVTQGFKAVGITIHRWIEVDGAEFDAATNLLAELPGDCDALFGLGGGKCLDVAKYVASLAGWPNYAVPTSLSNDGFCAPQSCLMLGGRRRSLPAQLPFGVVVDMEACLQAPDFCSCSMRITSRSRSFCRRIARISAGIASWTPPSRRPTRRRSRQVCHTSWRGDPWPCCE